MTKFIYASYLRPKREEFFELVAEKMKETYEYHSKSGYKTSYLEFSVYISPNIIPDSYINSLKKELIENYGWKEVIIEKQSGKIYIKTEV